MLRPDYRYIAFDFETTGLDTTKDDPVQIGIVEFDHTCTVLRTYQSLIKPTKPISELKEIVRYVTGFKLEDLENAPSYQSLLPEIAVFFDEKTVIVGQNIGFDLAFLHRLLPDFTPVTKIDTFHRSKIAWHFQSSYALDVVAQMLLKKGKIDTNIISDTDQAHDALHDSLTTLAVRKATLEHIHTIRKKYLLVDYCIQRNDGEFNRLLQRTPKDYKFEEKELFFPPLKKTIPPERSLVGTNEIEKEYISTFDSERIDVSSGSLSQFLDSIDRSSKQWIIATNSRSKTTLIRKWFDAKYLPHTTLQSRATFDPDRINRLLHQEILSDSEIGFIIKYYSHHLQGHAMMDTNTSDEYMIFQALTVRSQQKKNDTIITTHDQLLTYGKTLENPESHILFMDNDRRIQSLKRHVSQPYDMYETLKVVDALRYETKLLGNTEKLTVIDRFSNSLSVFLGVLGSGLNELFRGYAEPRRSCDFLLDETRIKGLRPLWNTIKNELNTLKNELEEKEYLAITAHSSRLDELLTGLCEVEKKMYHGDKWYYVLKTRDPYLDREQLTELLPASPITYVSLKSGEESQKITFEHTPKRPKIYNITTLKPLDGLLTATTGNCFVFSSAKHISQSVFKHRIGNGMHERFVIIGENITGGTGKNLYLAQQSKEQNTPLLAIGGYHFFMALLEKNFAFPSICMYYSKGAMTSQIVTDFVWWSR